MNICVDRMVKEIVDDELEYKKYKLSCVKLFHKE